MQVCLTWRHGGACPFLPGSTFKHVCLGDERGTVLDSQSREPITGGGNVLTNWGAGERYCQWVRWKGHDDSPQAISFSVRSSDGGKCMKRARQTLAMRLKGIGLTCEAPKANAYGSGTAGCQGNDGVDNECLWSLEVPRPGSPGWDGDVCYVQDIDNPPPPSKYGDESPPPPPRRQRDPSQRQPNSPSSSPPPPPPPKKGPIDDIPFPFCNCKVRSSDDTPYRLKYLRSRQLGRAASKRDRQEHCFTVETVACNPKKTCCDMGEYPTYGTSHSA